MMKVKLFKKDILMIASNVIISRNNFIQIRNITRVWHGKLDVNIPYSKIFLIFIASIVASINGFAPIGIIGILLSLGMAGYYGYLWSHYTLNFELTSGEVYAFTSLREDFLIESYEKVKKLLEKPKAIQEVHEFNFNNCEVKIIEGDNIEGHNVVNAKDVSNSPIHFQSPDNSVNINASDHSSVGNVSTNNKNVIDSNNTKINYQTIYKELNDVENTLKEQNNLTDLEIIAEAKKHAKDENESKLKETLKKLSKSTINLITVTSGLATIADFINTILK